MLVSPQARDIVGSYIYEKMGRSGLIITIQAQYILEQYAFNCYDELV